ncbi:MAG: hypothetical protein ACK58L_21040 [Planctomycetota bacterium]
MARPARNRRTQRTPRSFSGVAEVCETRSLLCAAWFNAPVDVAPVDVIDTTVVDASGEESDFPTPDDGAVTDEMLFSVGDAGTSEEAPRLEICSMFPGGEVETDVVSPELTENTEPEEKSLIEESIEFVDYGVDGLPNDWDPSWGHLFLSVTTEESRQDQGQEGEYDPEVPSLEFTSEMLDLSLLESIDLSIVDDVVKTGEVQFLEDHLNPEDLLAVCFRTPPTEDSPIDVAIEPVSDDSDVKSEDVVSEEFVGEITEDWNRIPPKILMTMVMRGYVPDGGGEETIIDVKTEDGIVIEEPVLAVDGDELWATGVLERCEDFPLAVYMPGAGGVEQDKNVDAVERVSDDSADTEVFVMDEIYALTGASDEIPMDRLPEESGLIVQRTLSGDVATPGAGSETEDSSAISRLLASYSNPNLFADQSDSEDAVGTLLARPASQPGSASVSNRSTSGPATRTAPKLSTVVSRRSLPPVALQALTTPLGDLEENESANSDAADSETDSAAENIDSVSVESDSSAQSAVNASANPVNRTRTIDLFMSRFHDEFFAG